MTTETPKTNGCNCDVCNNNRSHDAHIQMIPESERQFFEMIYDQLLNTQFDNEYYKAIMEGSWPSAVPILERALANAKQMQLEREKKNAAS